MPGISFQTIKDAITSFLGESKGEDAIDMLIADHKRVKQIFDTYKDMDDQQKLDGVQNALIELALHAAVEEELVYPLLGQAGEKEGLNESKEEHHVMKFLMSELEGMPVGEELDAKFKVLSEIVEHHVKEEENDYFPKIREKGEADLHELGERITERKEELLKKLGDSTDLGIIDPELRKRGNSSDGTEESTNGARKLAGNKVKSRPAKKPLNKKPAAKSAAPKKPAKNNKSAANSTSKKKAPAAKSKKPAAKTAKTAKPTKITATKSSKPIAKKQPSRKAAAKPAAKKAVASGKPTARNKKSAA